MTDTHLLGDERFIQRSDEPSWNRSNNAGVKGSTDRSIDKQKRRGYDEHHNNFDSLYGQGGIPSDLIRGGW